MMPQRSPIALVPTEDHVLSLMCVWLEDDRWCTASSVFRTVLRHISLCAWVTTWLGLLLPLALSSFGCSWHSDAPCKRSNGTKLDASLHKHIARVVSARLIKKFDAIHGTKKYWITSVPNPHDRFRQSCQVRQECLVKSVRCVLSRFSWQEQGVSRVFLFCDFSFGKSPHVLERITLRFMVHRRHYD